MKITKFRKSIMIFFIFFLLGSNIAICFANAPPIVPEINGPAVLWISNTTALYDVNGTQDPDNDPLTYTWNVSSGGTITGNGKQVLIKFPSIPGNYAVMVQVSDGVFTITKYFRHITVTQDGYMIGEVTHQYSRAEVSATKSVMSEGLWLDCMLIPLKNTTNGVMNFYNWTEYGLSIYEGTPVEPVKKCIWEGGNWQSLTGKFIIGTTGYQDSLLPIGTIGSPNGWLWQSQTVFDPQIRQWVTISAPFTDKKRKPYITSFYRCDKGDLIGFIHFETSQYAIDDPVHDFYGTPPNGNCTYEVGLAYSNDGGHSWIYCGDIITQQNTCTTCLQNIGGISYVTNGDFFYVYFTEVTTGGKAYTSVARAKVSDVVSAARANVSIKTNPTPWFKWNGTDWSTEKGLGGLGVQVISVACIHGYAAYCKATKEYLYLIDNIGATESSLDLYTSSDGLAWKNAFTIDKNANYHPCASFASNYEDASIDNHELGNQFYIIYPHVPPNSGTCPTLDICTRKVITRKSAIVLTNLLTNRNALLK